MSKFTSPNPLVIIFGSLADTNEDGHLPLNHLALCNDSAIKLALSMKKATNIVRKAHRMVSNNPMLDIQTYQDFLRPWVPRGIIGGSDESVLQYSFPTYGTNRHMVRMMDCIDILATNCYGDICRRLNALHPGQKLPLHLAGTENGILLMFFIINFLAKYGTSFDLGIEHSIQAFKNTFADALPKKTQDIGGEWPVVPENIDLKSIIFVEPWLPLPTRLLSFVNYPCRPPYYGIHPRKPIHIKHPKSLLVHITDEKINRDYREEICISGDNLETLSVPNICDPTFESGIVKFLQDVYA